MEARKTYVGGSSAAALLGVCPYMTRELFVAQRLGLVDAEPDRVELRMRERMEQFVATEFALMYGWALTPDGWLTRDDDCHELAATPDYTMEMPDGASAVLDVKVVRSMPRDQCKATTKSGAPSTQAFLHGLPLHYACQLQAQMACIGPQCRYGALIVLHLVPDLRCVSYWVPRHDAVIARIRHEATTVMREIRAAKGT